jgi:hypothetical protein
VPVAFALGGLSTSCGYLLAVASVSTQSEVRRANAQLALP